MQLLKHLLGRLRIGRRRDLLTAQTPIDEAVAFMERIQALHRAAGASNTPLVARQLTSREGQREYIDMCVAELSWRPEKEFDPNDPTSSAAKLYRTLDDPRMGRFENPFWFFYISTICEAIERTIPRLGLSCPHPPLFGTLETGRVNGMALQDANLTDPVIFIESGFFGFTDLFAKIFAQCLPVEVSQDGAAQFSVGDDEVRTFIAARAPTLSASLTDVLVAVLIYGHPHRARQHDIAPERQRLASIIKEAMDYFVVAHEYGHFLCGHLQRGVKRAVGEHAQFEHQGTSTQHLEVAPQSWKEEFEADTVGHSITIQALHDKNRIDPSIIHLGIEFTFHSIALIQEAQSILMKGRVEHGRSPTHPPASERILGIRESYKKFMGEHARQGEVGLASVGQLSLAAVWDITKPSFVEFHKDEIRPIRMWST